MGSRRHSKYSIFIICEGKNTEPYFFRSLQDDMKDGKYNSDNAIIEIKPEPVIPENDITTPTDRGRYSAKPRRTKSRKGITVNDERHEEDVIKGIPPLNWVNEGIKDLRDGINEVWVVFDRDGHPAVKEAFEAAKEDIDGKHVNIAFSSICFEYYLLLHFEKIYTAFEKSECNEKQYIGSGRKKKSKTVSFHCMTKDAIAEKACEGNKCVNGHARSKGYWQESKTTVSTYDLVKDKLINGICNAVWLREQSNRYESGTAVYERNPYTTLDKLIERLIGYTYLCLGDKHTIINVEIERQSMEKIKFENKGKHAVVIPPFNKTDGNNCTPIGEQYLLYPGDKYLVPLSDCCNNDIYVLTFENKRFLFHTF